MTIPYFKPGTGQKYRSAKGKRKERWRGNAADRGYDADWTRLSLSYRSSVQGLCEECGRRGIVATCDVVDHMIPVKTAPDLRLDWRNLDALCHGCHNGWKRLIENWAIKSGQARMLPIWVKHPETRPAHFQIRVRQGDVSSGIAFNRSVGPATTPAKAKAISPAPDPVLVFSGPGVVETMVNGTDEEVEILDGDDVVYILPDGMSLQSRIMVQQGLSLRAERASAKKVSVSYVCDRA